MKKLFILLLLFSVVRTGLGQVVPDVIRTPATPSTGSNKNNRSSVDANLYVAQSMRIPRASTFTLNNAKDSIGYVMFNTTSNRFGVYRGSGVWDTYIAAADTATMLSSYVRSGAALATYLTKANNLSDLTNASIARTNLGVTIGTDVLAYRTFGTAANNNTGDFEPTIAAGTALKYWRGDKTFQTLNTAAVPELTNLYYTNARGIGSTLTGYTSGAGTVSESDNILQAIQKLNGNIVALTTGVSSVTGTTNRLTASPTNGAVVVDISASYVGQSSITTLGTIGAGVWQGTSIADAYISSASTWNAKQSAITFGTGVQPALGINIGSAGAPVLYNGAGGTPSSMVGTNITGTASGLTVGNVITNANLTGPITSVGNATSIASQTGTGTKFVVDTSPTLVTPILGVAAGTSLSLSGNQSASSWTTNGLQLKVNAATLTNTSTAGGGTVALQVANAFGRPTFASTNAITITNAAVLYIPNPPLAGTNTTITNPFSLYIDNGNNYLGTGITFINATTDNGSGYKLQVNSGASFAGNIDVGSTSTITNINLRGSNSGSNGGASLGISNGGTLIGFVGNYSQYTGSTYDARFTVQANSAALYLQLAGGNAVIGAGTDDAVNKLQVIGSAKFTGIIYGNTDVQVATKIRVGDTGNTAQTQGDFTGSIQIGDDLFGNYTTGIKIGPSTTTTSRITLNQDISGGANILLQGRSAASGNPANPLIIFGDSQVAYGAIKGTLNSASTSAANGDISIQTSTNVATTALTDRLKVVGAGRTLIGVTLPSDNASYDLIVGANGALINGGITATSFATSAGTAPITVASNHLTAQTAVGTIVTYTVGASNETLSPQVYHIVTTTLVGTLNYQVTFTDINNVAVTYKCTVAMGTVVGYMGVAPGSGVVSNTYSFPLIRAKAGTVVTLMTIGTLSSGVFDVGGTITKLN